MAIPFHFDSPCAVATFSDRYGFLLRWHRVSLGLGFELLVHDLISRPSPKPTPKQTLLLILLPMLGTVLCLRLYLHLNFRRRLFWLLGRGGGWWRFWRWGLWESAAE